MSQATKRKHVVKEVLGDFVTPTENQQIVRVVGSPGNNLHEAVTSKGERFLVSMPTKFRKNIWIKRGKGFDIINAFSFENQHGDFVIVDPIEEGDKVKGEISFILYRDHIHHLQKLGVWPAGFQDNRTSDERKDGDQRKEKGEEREGECSENSESEEDDSDLFVNTNRTNYHYTESEDDSEDEEESDDDDGENEDEEEEGDENSV